jgi:hypothetical protein
MRISDAQRYVDNIEWFGIDRNQHIAYFTTGAYGSIPESIANSQEDLDIAVDFFTKELRSTTSSYKDITPLTKLTFSSKNKEVRESVLVDYFADYLEFSKKGIYCYDAESKFAGQYFKVSYPHSPLIASSLPTEIFSILQKTSTQIICFNQCNLIPQDLREIGWALPTN